LAGRDDDLHKTISRIVDLIVLCEQALQMIKTIAERAEEINARSLGNFFGPVQYAFFDTLILNTCSIFESSKKYHQYSVPEAIDQLRSYRSFRREPFIEAIRRYGLQATDSSSNSDLIKIYTSEIDKRMKANDISGRLRKFRAMRNKVVAHHQVNVEVKRSLDIDDANYLLSFAKNFVSTVGFALFDSAYSDDEGGFMLDGDAGRASRAARRILEHMGILALEQHDEVKARMLASTIKEAQWSEAVKARLKELLFSGEERRA
jgi:hypothetical protein